MRAAPHDDGRIGFGLDAARVPIRFAEDCDPASRAIAADLWPELRTREAGHPVELVAAAAAADAAGERAAWVALGRVVLTTDLAGSCE